MVRGNGQKIINIYSQLNNFIDKLVDRFDRLLNGKVNLLIISLYVLLSLGMYFLLPVEHERTYIFYIGVILGSTFFALLAERSKTTLTFNMLYGLSFFILFFTLALRNMSGIDDDSYIRIFNEVSQEGWIARFKETTMEPGYLMLNALVALFTDNYIYMQVVSSFIPLALFFYTFKKYRFIISLPMAVFMLSTLIYFQILSVGLVRMFIAISIVFTAYYFIAKRDTVKYIALILIASMFHYSALFMLILLYFAFKNNLVRRAWKFVLLVLIITPIAFILVSMFLVPLMGPRYAIYGDLSNFNFSISSLSTVPVFILFLLFFKRIGALSLNHFKLYLSVFALTIILSFFGSMIPMGRLIFYTDSAMYIAAPMVIKALNREPTSKLFFGVSIVTYCFAYVYRTQFTLESHIPHLFPYQNIFFTIQ
jgi:hypothetical protein